MTGFTQAAVDAWESVATDHHRTDIGISSLLYLRLSFHRTSGDHPTSTNKTRLCCSPWLTDQPRNECAEAEAGVP